VSLGAIYAGVRGFLKALWRATRQLFHETTGTFFLLLALSAGASAFRNLRHGPPLWPMWMTLAYALMMAGFGISSFRMARRVR
jgi:divalent metal cation (Fe/Co/Zn/Cd) transporter